MNFGSFYYGKLLKLFFFLLVTLQTAAQEDPIFTQYMFNGQIYNPAYAGMWEKIGFTALGKRTVGRY